MQIVKSLNIKQMSRSEKIALIELLQEKQKRKDENFVALYKPNFKQKEFHRMGNFYGERCFMAGNQLGKTLAGACEASYHLTGMYPEWWSGMRFTRPVTLWACGVTSEVIRDSIQLLMCGNIEKNQLGCGTIPRYKIGGSQNAYGVANCLDSVTVKHVTGGISTCKFKPYSRGREKFQASTIDIIWFDEEPPVDIYGEGKTRTNNGQFGQTVMLTYTPLLGMSTVTEMFLKDPSEEQVLINMTIRDVDHYTEEEKEKIIAGYLPHEREARANGVPILGSGRVFSTPEEALFWEPHDIPKHWPQLNGGDFGYDHPQAWVNFAWDRDLDIIYITKAWKERECTPVIAASVVKKWGEWVPCAWPHDGHQHDKGGSNKQLAGQYRDAGMNMHETHATHEAGGFGTEAGVSELMERMKSGRLKVNKYLFEWFEEYRMYHRKDGKIVKERDDFMSATRIGAMMLRIAETKPLDDEYYEEPAREESAMGW
jgi:phage terminase large subunit-like protein